MDTDRGRWTDGERDTRRAGSPPDRDEARDEGSAYDAAVDRGVAAVERVVVRARAGVARWVRAPDPPTGRDLGTAGWTLVAASALVGLVVAIRALPEVLYDDAPIIFRYVERIVDGAGWTYNDGDRTNGVSAPLYAMVLVVLRVLGTDLETAAKAVGVMCYAASLGLVAYIGARFRGVATGAIAVALLLTSSDFRAQSLGGLEVGVAVTLGLVVVALLAHDRQVAAGVVLGLAVVNKLDAGFLALAVAVAVVVMRRQVPWRLARASALVAAPWFVFSQLYFGSVLPHSATQKLSDSQLDNPAVVHDRAWIWDALGDDSSQLLLVLAVVLMGALVASRSRRAIDVALVACVLWGIVHFAAYSLVDLGDQYPWYRTVVYPPIALGAAGALVVAIRLVARRRGPSLVVGAVALGLVVIAVTVQREDSARELRTVVSEGHTMTAFEAFDGTRRAAGRYIGAHAADGEVVRTCFGWIAYGALQSPIDETCPLNTSERPPGQVTWIVDIRWPGVDPPPMSFTGYELVAGFVSEREPPGSTWVWRLAE